jgi:hypothetical protein
MVMTEDDDRFSINTSTIQNAGNGLFARKLLEKGERLEVIGVLLRAGSVADLCTQYADCYKFRVGEFLLIPVGFGGMVNHSIEPNMEKVIEGRTVFLRTNRVIQPGEELSFRYSETFFKVMNLDPQSFLPRGGDFRHE